MPQMTFIQIYSSVKTNPIPSESGISSLEMYFSPDFGRNFLSVTLTPGEICKSILDFTVVEIELFFVAIECETSVLEPNIESFASTLELIVGYRTFAFVEFGTRIEHRDVPNHIANH